MKWLKKISLFIFVLLIAIASSGLLVIYLYKDKAIGFVKAQINEHLNTEIHVKDINFSVFRNFPYASVEFSEVFAKEPQRNEKADTLFYMDRFSLLFNLKDIFNERYIIKKLIVENGKIWLAIDEKGRENYRFWKSSPDTSTASTRLTLNEVRLLNTIVEYTNKSTQQDYLFRINKGFFSGLFFNENYTLKGDFDLFISHFKASGINYADNKPAKIFFQMDANNHSGTYTLKEGQLALAKLSLDIKGNIISKEKGTETNLTISSASSDLNYLISILPSAYAETFNGYAINGLFSFNSDVKGLVSATQSPMVTVDFKVKNGMFSLREYNFSIRNVQFNGTYKNHTGKEYLKIENINALIADGPVKGDLRIENFSDPFLTLNLQADFDLKYLPYLIRTDTIESMEGRIHINTHIKSKTKDFTKYIANTNEASGKIMLNGVYIKLKKSSLEYKNIEGYFVLQNNITRVSDFKGNISNSDFVINGVFKNILPFIFSSGKIPIEAYSSWHSDFIDLDQILSANSSSATDTVYKLEVPFLLRTRTDIDINKLRFRNIEASAIKGSLTLNNRQLDIHTFSFNAMDGKVNISQGSIDMNPKDNLLIACDAHIKDININKLFYQFENFGQDVMTEKNINGRITADIQLASVWTKKLEIDAKKVYVNSNITIEDGELTNFEPAAALSKFIKLSELKNIKFSTLQNQIEIKNSNIYIPSMEIKSSAMSLIFSGVHTFNNDIDYRVRLHLSELLGRKVKERSTEFGTIQDDGLGGITLFLSMKGPADNPKISYDRTGLTEKIRTNIKTEKQTLKSILNKEFGWFKKDTSEFKQKKKQQNKESYSIEWDEDSTTDNIKPGKELSKTEQQRKNAFKKLKEKLQVQEE